MSCLNINIERVLYSNININTEKLEGINTKVDILSNKLYIQTESLSDLLNINIVKNSSTLNIYPSKINKSVDINFSIICDVPNIKYLKVNPKEVQWIPSWGLTYEIRSNTEWEVN